MGFGTLYVQADGDVDEVRKKIENLKKKGAPQTQQIMAVRKVDVPHVPSSKPTELVTIVARELPGRMVAREEPNIMIEFNYNKKTNLHQLEQQVSGISGVRIIKSIASF
jgi:hypothetical protein